MRSRCGAGRLPGVRANVCVFCFARNPECSFQGYKGLTRIYAAGQEQAAISATGSRSQIPSRRIFVPEGYLKM